MRKRIKALPNSSLRETLIGVSEDIIEMQGLDALSLRGAARAAGVSHMAPYRHFDDKDSLLAAVAGKGFHRLAQAMIQPISGLNDPQERLQQIGVEYVYFAYSHPGLYRLMFSAGIRDRSRFIALTEAGKAAYSVCERAVADCHTGDNELPAEKLRYKALAMWSLVHGLANLLIDKHIDLPSEEPEIVRQMIANTLQASRIEGV